MTYSFPLIVCSYAANTQGPLRREDVVAFSF